MRKLLTISLFLLVFILKAQELQFSQYYAASLYLNPAFAGIYNNPSLHINHKQQIQAPQFITELSQVSLILPIKVSGRDERSIGGVGLMVFDESTGLQGFYNRTSFFANYAHNLKLGLLDKFLLSFSLQAGFESRQLNFSNLTWGSQYNSFYGFDDTLPPPVTEFDAQQNNVVINAGVMYHFNPSRNYLLYKYSAFVGISATNLNRPNTSFSLIEENQAPFWMKYNGGIEVKVNKFFITPSLLAIYRNRSQQFNAGLNFAYVPKADRYRAKGPQLLFGSWYRFRDSFIFMAGTRVKSLSVRFSYDMNSTLFVAERQIDIAQNSMEISIQYSLSPSSTIRKISNPLF